MTMFATNETFSDVVHIYKLLTLLPPPSHIYFQGPELSCSIAIICFLIVVSQHQCKGSIISMSEIIWNFSSAINEL